MQPKRFSAAALITGLLLAAPVASLAAAGTTQEPPARKEQPHHGLPPEAYRACEGKEAGEAVIIETPRGDEIEAVCRYVDDRLVAKPLIGPPPMPGEEE
jgi:hypothetical protein